MPLQKRVCERRGAAAAARAPTAEMHRGGEGEDTGHLPAEWGVLVLLFMSVQGLPFLAGCWAVEPGSGCFDQSLTNRP